MEHNEIAMFMDVKLDIHDKRANALKFKSWNRCEVKVEAIKCVPCFLRISFQRCAQDEETSSDGHDAQHSFTVSINVPGVNISLATSRTKQYSYGLFWTQNRRDCFIYFALETEASCRRHMKWMKKSIKNLELYRQIFLEQRRLSRDPGRLLDTQQDVKSSELGPLPKLPDATLNGSCMSARISEIYEEIFEGHDHSRLSRRYSRASIASGIYEEMKPSTQNFQSIVEEPPALPPLPAQRKRINTFEPESIGFLGEIPRSNTNPESELAKKKKYKIMLDNIFGSARQKRAESISECEQPAQITPLYENTQPPETPQSSKATAKQQQSKISKSQRNSFSSPDLSKLNFLDTFDEAHIADILQQSDDSSEALNLSLDDSAIEHPVRKALMLKIQDQLRKADSIESLNVSEQLPNNFNFSACNTSKINLIGAQCAVPAPNLVQKNKILVDDFTGYCVMAPILTKTSTQLEKPAPSTESTSSGYSTGSYCSSTSSCNTAEEAAKAPINDSDIYETMMANALNESNQVPPTVTAEFAEHLYENLLAIKAAQELEAPSFALSTSTPTDSPQLPALPQKGTPKNIPAEEEDFYQTPRKSIISVDDKIPSYYPNSCDTIKTKRRSRSPERVTPTSGKSEKSASTLRHLVNMKMRRERKENLYISSPQQIIDQRQKVPNTKANNATLKTKTHGKKPAAHKISDNVYAVTHTAAHGKKSTNTNKSPTTTLNNNDGTFTDEMKEKLHAELRQLALLQNIDFKFDDGETKTTSTAYTGQLKEQTQQVAGSATIAEQDEYEHCYQAAENATRLLQKYATLAKFGGSPKKSAKHATTTRTATHLSPSTASASSSGAMTQSATNSAELQLAGVKKFASLPRFKKFDLSPLKMKLNNVLQRHPPTPPPSTLPES